MHEYLFIYLFSLSNRKIDKEKSSGILCNLKHVLSIIESFDLEFLKKNIVVEEDISSYSSWIYTSEENSYVAVVINDVA